jgi:hypothetical protein
MVVHTTIYRIAVRAGNWQDGQVSASTSPQIRVTVWGALRMLMRRREFRR